MPSGISRRRFLRDSAIVSGGAMLVGAAAPSASFAAAAPGGRRHRSPGVFAQMSAGQPGEDVLVRWTRAGGSSSLELTAMSVRLHTPHWGAQEIDLVDFEQGRGEHDVERSFGSAALQQLRQQVASRRFLTA